jgi:lysophospholipase L1-like esterase
VPIENRYRLTANIKNKRYGGLVPSVTANDNTVFEIELYDDSILYPVLETYRYTLVTYKKNRTSVIREGALVNGLIEFALGSSETTESGRVEATVQIYDVDNKRISAAPIAYQVIKDPSLEGSLPADEKTLVIANESLMTAAIEKSDLANGRIDTIVAQAGTDNTEIVDLRVRPDGTSAASAGAHVRELSTSVAQLATKKDVATTPDWDWSETNKNYYFEENGQEFTVKGTPNADTRKVVFAGSSVLYGQGATNNMGWARLVGQNLTNKGYTVVNRGIPGSNTASLISRFYKDVITERPDIVVVGLNLTNENIQGQGTIEGKRTIYQTFIKNMKKIISKIKQIGAEPVIASSYPSGAYGVDDYYFARLINKEIESWGVKTLNLMNIGDDGTGKWHIGITDDGLHPNDIGAATVESGINEELFDNIWKSNPFEVAKNGSVKTGVDATNLAPMDLVTSKTIKSFTVFFKMKPNDGNGIYVFGGSRFQDARLRNSTGVLDYTSASGATITSTAPVKTEFRYYDVALTYNHFTNKVKLYVDGVKAGEVTDTLNNTAITLGGGATATYNAKNTEYKDFLLYRVPLTDIEIKELSKGNYLRSGLELYSPLSDYDLRQGGQLLNLAPTNSYLKINASDLTSI